MPGQPFTPVAVHTTFQFGDTAEFAWGKRSRLRERLLWKVDQPHYFAFEGDYSPGKGASEEGYGGFIQLLGIEELNGAPRPRRARAAPAPRRSLAFTSPAPRAYLARAASAPRLY